MEGWYMVNAVTSHVGPKRTSHMRLIIVNLNIFYGSVYLGFVISALCNTPDTFYPFLSQICTVPSIFSSHCHFPI